MELLGAFLASLVFIFGISPMVGLLFIEMSNL